MRKQECRIALKEHQKLLLVPIGDIHFDTAECDRTRLKRFVDWVLTQEEQGALVRMVGLGDYLDFASPSNRLRIRDAYETTLAKFDRDCLRDLDEFVTFMGDAGSRFLGLLTGHHHYKFHTVAGAGKKWVNQSSDAYLANAFGCNYWGEGVAFLRLALPHSTHLDVLLLHGSGGSQTPGGRVQKRMRFAEIAPTAHIVISGHDNAKFAYPRSGLDWERGAIKRYVVGSGSFQRAYLEEEEAGYAEKWGLVPADLGVSIITVQVEKRSDRWRVDYHVSV